MTALTRVFRWLRGPWVAHDPAPDLSWLDRADGLRDARADLHATLRAEGTRYDAEWPDVLAAEGGLALGRALDLADLPADQSGFTGWDYGEGYEIEPEERAVAEREATELYESGRVSWAAHRAARIAAHPTTPPVDEADVEALAGILSNEGDGGIWEHFDGKNSREVARRLLATGRVSVTR